ncbi:MAG: proline--tRNA ligase [Candidatus Mycalebacterium zealandia]|nr:MAG: proline--tRNA ligase [Candidatus Mycalebacterium zealandia]
MRFSSYFIPTLKNDPSDAEVASHKLMTRAGMIRKVAAGIYDYLPLGLRSIRKIEEIVRDEMNSSGAVELLLPAVAPAELWKKSGRWDYYGKELLRFKDRAERDFCIGPTHEEVITEIAAATLRSYKDLPKNLYQIQTKFRDEIRPRFGVMRAREFIMKDSYSFDISVEEAKKSYEKMYKAYGRIFERCGLDFRAVIADTGSIGGSESHEFMVLAQSGEDVVMSCEKCGYAANLELAGIAKTKSAQTKNSPEQIKEVETPGMKTVEDVAKLLKTKPSNLIKTLIVKTDAGTVSALVGGDRELSLTKLKKFLGAQTAELANKEEILRVSGGAVGFSGPVEMKEKINTVADFSIKGMSGAVVGANKKDFHLINVAEGRDFEPDSFADIHVAKNGDGCTECSGALSSIRGIEVGHVFLLGTKYSEAMEATFTDKDGKEKPFVMGCYGIGIGRTVAAAIEQNNDGKSMVFPPAIAPFEIAVIPTSMGDEQTVSVAEKIYNGLVKSGADALIDDRDESAGVKFKDCELTGAPFHVVVGPKGLKDGTVEIKNRLTDKTENIETSKAVDFCRNLSPMANQPA